MNAHKQVTSNGYSPTAKLMTLRGDLLRVELTVQYFSSLSSTVVRQPDRSFAPPSSAVLQV